MTTKPRPSAADKVSSSVIVRSGSDLPEFQSAIAGLIKPAKFYPTLYDNKNKLAPSEILLSAFVYRIGKNNWYNMVCITLR
jgi:hypothetical protein